MPLVVPVSLLVNTPASTLLEHIETNSKNIRKWVKMEEAHDRVAIICGSAPSLSDCLEEIKDGDIFALNAAADFLNKNGILPDYQVIIDAKEETVGLVGEAKNHFFGSTVDPACFELKPNATLFQLQVDDDVTMDLLNSYAPHEYALLSTAVSVGVVSVILAYTLGYRKIRCYGVDSSHKDGESHVVRQAMNDRVPCMDVEFCGKKYLSSFPMKVQAERFMQVANLLKRDDVEISVHGSGLLPDMFNADIEDMTEQEKYERMWSMYSYRQSSPAERIYKTILEKLNPTGRILDFGCGTGRAARLITDEGFEVQLIDFANNCRDQDAQELPFTQIDLSEPIPLRADYGYCVDVMEHIPTESVETVIQNIMASAEKVFFQISTINDRCGLTIGKELHLTIKPLKWWISLFEKNGHTVEWSYEDTIECQLVVRR